MRRIIFFTCFVVSLFTQQIYAQNFERISNKEGFNQNTVNAIEQDKYGFLWYATPNGLIRYDGYEFKTFSTQSKSEGAISSNNITYLFNDKNGILWIGTNVGVNIYVPWLERFFTVPITYNIDVNKIDSENDGYVWISSSKELIRCKLKDANDGVFDKEIFQQVSTKIKADIDVLNKELSNITFSLSNYDNYLDESLELVNDYKGIWEKGDIQIKKDIQNILFSNQIEYDPKKMSYRTPKENLVMSMLTGNRDKIKARKRGQKPTNSRIVRTPIIELFFERP